MCSKDRNQSIAKCHKQTIVEQIEINFLQQKYKEVLREKKHSDIINMRMIEDNYPQGFLAAKVQMSV